MIGTTGLHRLTIDCIVGIHPHERETPQPIVLDVELDYDFGPVAQSDAMANAVDYDFVVSALTALLQTRKFQLIEAMAEAAAALLLDRLAPVVAVRLEIRKPAAVPSAASSFVRVERVRP